MSGKTWAIPRRTLRSLETTEKEKDDYAYVDDDDDDNDDDDDDDYDYDDDTVDSAGDTLVPRQPLAPRNRH